MSKEQERIVAEWNANHPVGTPVTYQEVMGLPPVVLTKTRSEAWQLGHGEPVVMIEGKTGGVCLSHVRLRVGRENTDEEA